jgi:hypothetical protein
MTVALHDIALNQISTLPNIARFFFCTTVCLNEKPVTKHT